MTNDTFVKRNLIRITFCIIVFILLLTTLAKSQPHPIKELYQTKITSHSQYDYISHLPGARSRGKIYFNAKHPEQSLYAPQNPINQTLQPFFSIEYLINYKERLYLKIQYPLTADHQKTRDFEKSL
ncbi:MAG: hypothetical protein CEN89_536 [Candidatus Berkelbacteria bacterium Licking1014_7]|uniref:Uncharacterized protein n=1 Tax=Candidatus Berkelbacteria bacterium Licking1014_7 TaxID=2017147 RepID=A0A554LIJ8_9BACT|nr:MAG: hypothetical protein CEN89_536 [Candidatus Berkelbacteria bacterium Licking1014_7]